MFTVSSNMLAATMANTMSINFTISTAKVRIENEKMRK